MSSNVSGRVAASDARARGSSLRATAFFEGDDTICPFRKTIRVERAFLSGMVPSSSSRAAGWPPYAVGVSQGYGMATDR